MTDQTMETTEAPNEVDVTDDLEAVEREMRGETAPEAKPEPVKAEAPAEADEEATGDDEEGEEKPERRKLSTADRINKMTRRMRDAEARAAEVDSLREELAALKSQVLTPKAEPAKVDSSSEPDPANYQYGELDSQYLRDLTDARVKQALADFETAQKSRTEQEQRQSAAQRETAAFQESVTKIEQAGAAKFSDFDELVVQGVQDGDWTLTKEMALALTEIPETAPDILYYLATYPEESVRVAAMSERQQAMWFGRMEAQLAEKPAPTARKITQASAPPASIPKGTGGGGGVRLDDLDDPRALLEIERQLFGRK